ncbi:MAG: thermonuclease family protein [Bacteroidales bacterium]
MPHFRPILFTTLLLLALCPVLFAQSSGDAEKTYVYYPVARVVDGDTFWIDDGSEKGLKIRLIGVDAPEPRNNGKKLKGYFGTESSDYMNQLIGGKKVRLEYDAGRFDQYGRTLAYVYLEDGTFVNADLVKNGYATVMTTPPNVKYADTFVDLAAKARKHKKGLWKESPQAD